jgi:sugar-specific transcriptional regulator TrmB
LDERAQKLLVQYGLTERESLVYLHLLSHGQLSAGEIAKGVEVRRMEAYRVIKRLADSGIVLATPGNPVKYRAEPIEEVVAKMMDEQMKKLQEMEKGRLEVISLGKSLPMAAAAGEEYRFKMVQGREQVYSLIQRMIDASTTSLDMILTRNDMVQLHILGGSERVRLAKKRGVTTKLISVVDYQTMEAAEVLMRSSEVRHSEEYSGRIVIGDGSEILVSIVLDDSQGRKDERDVAIWTNSKSYAGVMAKMFERAFSSSLDAKDRIVQLKSGRRGEERTKALIDVLRATLPLEGWKVECPGRLKGISGREYEFPAVLTQRDKTFAVEIVIGNSEKDTKEPTIGGIMKGIEVKGARVIVIASPRGGDELVKLANLVGVSLIDGSDTVSAVTRVRKEINA